MQTSSRSPQKASQRVHKGDVPVASERSTDLHDRMGKQQAVSIAQTSLLTALTGR